MDLGMNEPDASGTLEFVDVSGNPAGNFSKRDPTY